MLNIKKISILLFLLVQMSVTFAGNPTDPNGRTYVGFWLVRQANDEIKQVKFVEMPATVMFEGTEDVNEPMVRELLGYEKMETFEGAAVVESRFMVMSFDSAEEVSSFNWQFYWWCWGAYVGQNQNCSNSAGQCKVPGTFICKGDNICFPSTIRMYCGGSQN
jgi:hypothetical protein